MCARISTRAAPLVLAVCRDFLRNDVSTFAAIKPGSDNIRGWRQSLFGFYLQDDINVKPGFTLNVGVRYEAISTPKEANGKVASIRDWSRHQEGLGPASGHFYTVPVDGVDVGDPYFVNPSSEELCSPGGLRLGSFPEWKNRHPRWDWRFSRSSPASRFHLPGSPGGALLLRGGLGRA